MNVLTLIHRAALCGLCCTALTLVAQEAVPFNSGSTGAAGELNINENTTLDLPPDGVLHCTTVNIAENATLRFNRNAANTPVYLLATGPITIAGAIELDGANGQDWGQGGIGGPGGFDGGNTTPTLQPGRGPGATRAGLRHPASHATFGDGAALPPTYGDPLVLTLVGGSGGGAINADGANRGGGGGGGAILIASSVSIQHSGGIYARGGRGGSGYENNGSGGAIRLVAPSVTGSGRLWVESAERWARGVGRVRIDSLNRTGFAFDHRAVYSAGANMLTRLPAEPSLRIVHAAGTDIAPTAQGVVRVVLPPGASAEQPLRIQARGFNATVPVRITLYPENSAAIELDEVIDNSQGEIAVKELTASFPANTPTRVMVWTRPNN